MGAVQMKNKLIDENENVQATIGYGYLKSLFVDKSLPETALDFISGGATGESLNVVNTFSKTFGIVTNKRVYSYGKTYEVINGKLRSTKGRKVVNIEDVTGTSIIKARKTGLLIVTILSFIVALFFFVLSSEHLSSRWDHALENEEFIICLLFTLVASCFLIAFYMKRENYISIEYAGGGIRLQTYMETDESIQNFQNTILSLKDSIKPVHNSPVRVESQHSEVIDENVVDHLSKAKKLYEDGLITEEDYNKLKEKILGL